MIESLIFSPVRHEHIMRIVVVSLLLYTGCTSPKNFEMEQQLIEIKRTSLTLPSDPVKTPLSLPNAIERACVISKDITTLVAAVEIASQRKKAVRDIRDPELRIGYGEDVGAVDRLRTSTALSGFETGIQTGTIEDDLSAYNIGLRLYLPNPWTYRAQNNVWTANIYAAMVDVLQARWLIKTEINRLYVRISHLEQDLKIVNKLVKVHSLTKSILEQRAAEGLVTIREVLSAKTRYLSSLRNRNEVLNRTEEARRELASMVGLPLSNLEIDPYGNFFTSFNLTNKDIDSLVNQAYDHRADLSALEWRQKSATAAYRAEKSNRRPWFRYIQGTVGYSESTMSRVISDTDLNTQGDIETIEKIVTHDEGDEVEWGITTAITLPFPGFNQETNLRFIELKYAKLQVSQARNRVKMEIIDAFAAVQSMIQSRIYQNTETEPLIAEMEENLEKIKNSGIDSIEISRIHEGILKSKRVTLESDYLYQLAIIELEQVLGFPLENN